MTERSSEQFLSGSESSAHPKQLRDVTELTIPPNANELVVPGFMLTPYAREVALPSTGEVFVSMNSAAYIKVPEGTIGQIYTIGLAGCTGIAGVAKVENGTLAGISHFDALVDTNQREQGMGASERFMNQFIGAARRAGANTIEIFITHSDIHSTDPQYGQLGGNYDDWHFLNQLESFAAEAEEDVRVVIEPYEGLSSHTLAVSVDRGTAYIAFE